MVWWSSGVGLSDSGLLLLAGKAGADPFSAWGLLIHHLGLKTQELAALKTVPSLQEPLFTALAAELGALWDPCGDPNHLPCAFSKAGQTCSVTHVPVMLCHHIPNGQEQK